MKRIQLKRRGIVLLVVLSLLALFTIFAVSFLLVSGQYRSAAAINVRTQRTVTPPDRFAEEALMQLLRDTTEHSALKNHSLLNDLYGSDGVAGQVTAVSAGPAVGLPNQFVQIQVQHPQQMLANFPGRFSRVPGYYAGRVISFTGNVLAQLNYTSPVQGLSARIVSYAEPAAGFDGQDDLWGLAQSSTPENRFEYNSDDSALITLEWLDGDPGNLNPVALPAVGDLFIINGQPFNGMGHGYDPATGNIDARFRAPGSDLLMGTTDDWPPPAQPTILSAALMPNSTAGSVTAPINIGGADESWDTFDYQNMFLAMVPPNARSSADIIPSFHRPELVYFWYHWAINNVPGLSGVPFSTFTRPYGSDCERNTNDDPSTPSLALRDTIVDILRGCTMRPLPEDHPNFRWNNETFNYLGNNSSNQWDVDNDGDGIHDSVWVDIGLPAQTAPDGKRFRPLVAILCQDLDGRLNLNAHGQDGMVPSVITFAQIPLPTNPVTYNYSSSTTVSTPVPLHPLNAYVSGNTERLPRGRGIGPAEVSLAPLVFGSSPAEHDRLIRNRYKLMLDDYKSAPAANLYPGLAGLNDPLSRLFDQGIPVDYLAARISASARAGYGFPADLRGFTSVGMDHYGQPIVTPINLANEAIDDPYEIVLGTHFGDHLSSSDTPYTVGELERILRYNDIDASRLPDRLTTIAPLTFDNAMNRRQVTVHSSHIPVVNAVALPFRPLSPTSSAHPPRGAITYHDYRNPDSSANPEEFGGNRGMQTILDAYYERIFRGLLDSNLSPTLAPSVLRQIVPFEILHGERFDLNRPFGNGADDNNNGVVDEPLESLQPTLAWPGVSNIPFNGGNDDPLTPGNPRITYARHLYCLMMLLVNPGANLPAARSSDTPPEVARRIAQYCVNVVDYRDPDAIMTAFEYDLQPFDGWDVDGDISTNEGSNRGVVWGCESPDLLITETVAFHDRRVKDTNFDTTQRRRDAANPASRDEDLDQYRIPQGSLFFELHCPRTSTALLPRELYSLFNGQEVLDLGRVDSNGFPVWRVAISNDSAPAVERPWDGTANPTPSVERFEPANIERVIWFAPVAPHGPEPYKIFYGRTPAPRIEPNGFAVVGPRPVTYLGARVEGADANVATWEAAQQRLEMQPTFQTFDLMGNPNPYLVPGNPQIRSPQSIICAADPPVTWVAGGPITEIGMNISEPLPQGPANNYYQQPNPGNNAYAQDPPDAYDDTANPTYTMPDQPFDEQAGMPLENFLRTGSPAGFRRSAYLQRLADPTRPWDVVTNPYLTVDWTTIDLTVFNGEEDNNRQINNPPEWVDPSDPDPFNSNPPERFNTRQRDGSVATYSGAVTIVGGANTISRTDGGNFINAGFSEGQQLLTRGTGPNNDLYLIQSVTPASLTVLKLVPGFSLTDNTYQQARLYAYTGNRLSPSTKEPWLSLDANTAMGTPERCYWDFNLQHTLGYLNEAFDTPRVPSPGYAGAPRVPYPWLAWMDRPFASAYELMDVPASAPSRLLYEFSTWNTNSRFYNVRKVDRLNPYLNDGSFGRFYGSHAHLMNFLLSATSPGAVDPNLFHHLFEAVHVPSRFVGTDRWYNPTDFANSSAYPNAVSFRPPFNKLSRFRDPGRININTILPDSPTSSRVWEGISKLFPEMDSTQTGSALPHPGADLAWGRAGQDDDNNGTVDDISEAGAPGSDDFTRDFLQRLLLSRQGYGTKATDLLAFNTSFPTRFANPFRAAAHADMMPSMNGTSLRKPGIEATLLRSDAIPHFDRGNNSVFGGVDDNQDMNVDDGQLINGGFVEAGRDDDLQRKEPLFVVDGSVHTNVSTGTRNQDQNTFLRHQALHRLGSLLTTNSNVYAIWITVGYFELEENVPRVPNQPNRIRTLAHPDGLRLGAELGLETGEIRRNRFFYMVDRSIPCAFEPGVDHNIENIILLRRSIE